MHEGQVEISSAAVAEAIAAQFPRFAHLPVNRVRSAGTVVAPFRIGESLVARLPLVPQPEEATRVRIQAEGERARLLRGTLPVEIPELVGLGEAFEGYPSAWSVWTWLEGEALDHVLDVGGHGCDLDAMAYDLANVLTTQRALPVVGPAWNGKGRGGRPLADSEWVRRSIERGAHLIDAVAATRVWERALAAPPYAGPPQTINGDPMPGNLLLRQGRLSGLIDISEPVAGDPAADLQPAWEIFEEPARSTFRSMMDLDEAAWERGRGWAFEMAIGGLHYYENSNPVFFALAQRTLDRLLATAR